MSPRYHVRGARLTWGMTFERSYTHRDRVTAIATANFDGSNGVLVVRSDVRSQNRGGAWIEGSGMKNYQFFVVLTLLLECFDF